MIHSNNGLLESPSPWQTIHHFTRQTINRANDDLYIGSAHYYTLGTFCKVILGGKGGEKDRRKINVVIATLYSRLNSIAGPM